MSVMPALLAILLADTGVDSIIDSRVHMSAVAEDAPRPLVMLVSSTEEDDYHMQGINQYPEAMFQVVCVADDFQTVEALGDAVIAALQDYSGTVSGKHVTTFREPVNAFDFVPSNNTHRRIVGFKARYRAVA